MPRRKLFVDDVQVRSAHTAGQNAQQYIVLAGLRPAPIFYPYLAAGSGLVHDGFHDCNCTGPRLPGATSNQASVLDHAVLYHRRFKPQALLVTRGGEIVHESYENGFAEGDAHPLFSGTKSFWGIAALTAQTEGLLSLDETVEQTIPAWRADPWKKRVTLRELLQLTAGVPFGGLGSAVPDYEKALATDLRAQPGTTFTYGGIPLQIFGAVFARKLQARSLTPHQYLNAQVLEPNGVHVARWRTLRDGTNPLPTGAFLTARDWLAYGTFVFAGRERFAEAFHGSIPNPRYGLGWWLALPNTPPDLVYASGSGGQALYVLPSLGIVAVRFGAGGSFNHAAFVKRLAAA